MLFKFEHYNNPSLNNHLSQHDSGLTSEEIDRIRSFGDSLDTTSVKLYGKFQDSHVRATGSHLVLSHETEWLYSKMMTLVQKINSENYQYDLTGFNENFYYLKYMSGDHFNWHLDMGRETQSPRKLSLVLQLSDPSEYEGGDFDVMVTDFHQRADKQKGLVVSFPSYKIHRVTPVLSGVRRTLVMFVTGPNFR